MEPKIFGKGFNFSPDGPGNRLVYHLNGCNMRCPWCSNPEGMLPEKGNFYTLSTEEIVNEATLSIPMFFEGGGVTFTGGEATLQFEGLLHTAKMLREKNNEVNRKQNFDMANLTKTVNAAGIYVDAIRALMESGDFEKLPSELRTTAQNRVDNDTLTLQELADMEEPPISKSQVSKRLQKIYHFYEENKQTEAKL